ncbi:hypothetical protein ACQ4PT_026552 [Festuca glaucescens]
MDQFVLADWTWSTNNGDAFAPSCAQDDGLVELLWSNSNVVMHSQPPPSVRGLEAAFIDDDSSPEMEIFSEIFCQTPADAGNSSTGKRKQRDAAGSPSEVIQDVEFESAAVTKCEPSTGKRRRAAQVHNLSERRRRDRINEKMRALQELIPHCNKTDKASMLDEAIDYLKSLQLRVQMMWTTGGGMPAPAPAMFPASGAHRYSKGRQPENYVY